MLGGKGSSMRLCDVSSPWKWHDRRDFSAFCSSSRAGEESNPIRTRPSCANNSGNTKVQKSPFSDSQRPNTDAEKWNADGTERRCYNPRLHVTSAFCQRVSCAWKAAQEEFGIWYPALQVPEMFLTVNKTSLSDDRNVRFCFYSIAVLQPYETCLFELKPKWKLAKKETPTSGK